MIFFNKYDFVLDSETRYITLNGNLYIVKINHTRLMSFFRGLRV